jgi:AraC-like DNA-binding protein
MNTLFNHVQDWLALARQANWSVGKLAKLCNVSTRTLERQFLKNMGKTPRGWLSEQRQHQAMRFLQDGSSVKETAARLGYKYATNFTRKFKKHRSIHPTA